jgi:RNA polymerase sigma-70 factor (ECF subfamily)
MLTRQSVPMMSDLEVSARQHAEALVRYAWACTGSLDDAQDVAQTTLLNALAALRKGHRPRNLKAWLFAIAHHEVCGFKRRRHRPLPEEIPARPDPDLRDLREAVSRIPEPYGPVLALRFVQGFSVDEIAELLDRPPATVKVYLWRALGMLREKFRRKVE